MWSPVPDVPTIPVGTTRVFTDCGGADFWSAPCASAARADGSFSAWWPNEGDVDRVNRMIALVFCKAGYAITAGVFFPLSGPVGPLPTVAESMEDGSPLLRVPVDPPGPPALFTTDFRLDDGPFGAPKLLTLPPVQGISLRAKTISAAVARPRRLRPTFAWTTGRSAHPIYSRCSLSRGSLCGPRRAMRPWSARGSWTPRVGGWLSPSRPTTQTYGPLRRLLTR